MDVRRVTGTLPDLYRLEEEANAEGIGIVRRLIAEWASGETRFDRRGEELLVVSMGEVVIAVGGVTLEPAEAGALRMRRFYVHPDHRGGGMGTALARQLIAARPNVRMTVHAGVAGAAPFWERSGFEPVTGHAYTHVLTRSRPPGDGQASGRNRRSRRTSG